MPTTNYGIVADHARRALPRLPAGCISGLNTDEPPWPGTKAISPVRSNQSRPDRLSPVRRTGTTRVPGRRDDMDRHTSARRHIGRHKATALAEELAVLRKARTGCGRTRLRAGGGATRSP